MTPTDTRRRFGTIPPEPPPMRSLNDLAPKFQRALERALDQLRGLGFTPQVVETLRTADRQRWLYGFGRDYSDGRGIVTHSQDGDETWHFYGLAADVICAKRGYNATKAFWDAAERAYERQGLAWGGLWTFVDKPHVQWGAPMRRSPSPRAARLYAEGGLLRVWQEVGAQ
jgi:hypothetical protein